jgi:adenylate cyclase class 2
MRIEVEQKYLVEDLSAVRSGLRDVGGQEAGERIEVDTYYAHPARDFARTDEALRIRRVDRSNLLAYKGPKLDATTKTRREIELPLGSGEEVAADWAALLEVLGFRPVAEVRKRRQKVRVPWQGRDVDVSLDEVDEVGTFVELELLTTEAAVDGAKAVIASLAEHLGLSESERRSYLELLLARRGEAAQER